MRGVDAKEQRRGDVHCCVVVGKMSPNICCDACAIAPTRLRILDGKSSCSCCFSPVLSCPVLLLCCAALCYCPVLCCCAFLSFFSSYILYLLYVVCPSLCPVLPNPVCPSSLGSFPVNITPLLEWFYYF